MTQWTEERRQKQRESILKNKPWERSTGPRTSEGKERSALNSVKTGEHSALFKDLQKVYRSHKRFMRDFVPNLSRADQMFYLFLQNELLLMMMDTLDCYEIMKDNP